ncbi:MAG: hypothetical protein PVH00_08245, partial [Gemmatimonadota bacterium]
DEAGNRRAAIRLLVDFRTWQVLTGAALDDAGAAALAVRMAECAGAEAGGRTRGSRIRPRA